MTQKKLIFPAFILFLITITFIFFNADSAWQPFVEFSDKPGTYSTDINLSVKYISPETTRVFYSFVNDFREKAPRLSFDRTLNLSAVRGERREYKLQIFLYNEGKITGEKQYTYVIDRELLLPPRIDVIPGIYNTTVSFRFIRNNDQAIHYSLSSPVDSSSEIIWDNNPVELTGEDGKKFTYTLQAYSINTAGNKSGTTQYQFIIDKSTVAMAPPAVTIVSPAAGTFANKQLLLLRETNLNWIKYSIDGSDPARKGSYWSEPLLIDKSGIITLKIVAQPRWTGSTLIKSEVKFTVKEESEPFTVEYTSGVYPDDITLKPVLKSGAWVYYTQDGTSPTEKSSVTQSYINLRGPGNAVNDIDCRIRYKHASGTLSGEYRYLFSIDKREVKNPVLTAKSPAPYRNTAEVQVQAAGGTVYYTFDGTTPGRDSGQAGDTIKVSSAEAGGDGYVLLKTIAYNNMGMHSDPVLFPLLFADTGKSEGNVRLLSGEESTGSRDITISLPAGKKYVYEISTGSSPPPDPEPDSQEAEGDIVLSVPPGMELPFHIKVAVLENNTITSIKPHSYLIDKKPPLNPVILGLPQAEAVNEPVTFSFEETGGNIYYQVTDDGSEPKISADTSPRYTSPVRLNGRDESDITYRINAIAVDDYGNVSPLVPGAKFRIDKKSPPAPGEPVPAPYGAEVEQKFTLSWNPENDCRLYYRFTGGSQYSDEFRQYTTPLLIDMAAADTSTLIECYNLDTAGNRSRTVTFRINEPGDRTPPPVLTGVENGGVYNRKVTIRFPAAGGNIHYELTTNGEEPDAVRITSPAASGELVCDAEEGRTVVYTIRARAFTGSIWDTASSGLHLTFTIDKTPPGLPQLLGAENNGYYYSSRQIAFTAHNGETVFYAISETDAAAGSMPSDFTAFREDFILTPEPGETGLYHITAFSRDTAGNISGSFASWSFIIDKKTIYVSGRGNDFSEGTRDKPFRSLLKALDFAAATGRKAIYLASGELSINRPVKITTDIEIHGGLTPLTWEREIPEKQTWCFTAKPFQGGYPLIEITNGAVRINGIKFTDPLNSCPMLLRQTGGSLVLENCSIVSNSIKGTGAVQSYQGRVEIRDSLLTAGSTQEGTLLQAAGGDAILSGTSFQGAENTAAFTCIRISENCQAAFNNITINPGSGKRTIGLEAADCGLVIHKSRIDSGSGLQNAVAVNLRNSSLTLTKSVLNGDEKAGYVVGILAAAGDIRVTESLINVTGEKGATGLHMTNAGIILDRSYLKARNTKEFIYMVNLNRCRGTFFNNLIRAADSGDTACVLLDDVQSQWINNTIIGGKGSGLMTAFLMKGRYASDIINNIIVHEQFNQGNAIYLVGSEEPDFLISCNNFSGWNRLLKIDFISGTGKVLHTYNPAKYDQITTVDLLNNLDGNPYGGKQNGNIDESYYKIFDTSGGEEYHLARSSACIDAGQDVHSLGYSELEYDIDGDKRPARGPGIKPAYDIGADEYTGE